MPGGNTEANSCSSSDYERSDEKRMFAARFGIGRDESGDHSCLLTLL
jgi:hypothetical protein